MPAGDGEGGAEMCRIQFAATETGAGPQRWLTLTVWAATPLRWLRPLPQRELEALQANAKEAAATGLDTSKRIAGSRRWTGKLSRSGEDKKGKEGRLEVVWGIFSPFGGRGPWAKTPPSSGRLGRFWGVGCAVLRTGVWGVRAYFWDRSLGYQAARFQLLASGTHWQNLH